MAAMRTVARVAAVLVPVAGVLAVVAPPAMAAREQVRLQAPSSFTAGGSSGSVTVSVSRRGRGCIVPQTSLIMRKPGLTAQQVRVEVARSGQWQSLGARQAGDGAVAVTVVERAQLCRGEATTRYRVALASTVRNGRITLTGAVSAGGQVLGTDSGSVSVRGGAATPKPTPTPTATATPEADETEQAAPTTEAPAIAATGAPSGGGMSLAGAMVTVAGGMLAVIGVAILFFLRRLSRTAEEGAAEAGRRPGRHAAPHQLRDTYRGLLRHSRPREPVPGHAPPADQTLTLPTYRE
jgi:hypothetical protein